MGKRDRGKVLFICWHNSARSQMAEGLLNHLAGEEYRALSAGIEPGEVNPLAIDVMKEVGIDISHHSSKGIDEFLGMEIDYVVTVCDQAKEACPAFPGGKRRIHRGFEDPSAFGGSREERLEAFRRARDDIRKWLEQTLLDEGSRDQGW